MPSSPKLSPAARHARATKVMPVLRQQPKRVAKGWIPESVQQPTSLSDLPKDLREKLELEAQIKLKNRIAGPERRPKLSHTFEEAAQALGIEDKQQIDALLEVTFAYAANHYRYKDGRGLSQLKSSVVKTLIEEDNSSEHEIRETSEILWGRRFNNTFKAYVSALRHDKDLTNTLDISSERVQDDQYRNGVPYTYYFLTRKFKEQMIKDAVAWDNDRGGHQSISQDTYYKIVELDKS